MIDAHNLTFSINGRRLTNNVSLTLPGGEIVAILGPNGAGKSTLLRQLTGYLQPDSGHCSLFGRPLGDWPTAELAKTRAVMRQNCHMAFPFSVMEVVRMAAIRIALVIRAMKQNTLWRCAAVANWLSATIAISPAANNSGYS